jgi:hypothetical protein
MDGADIGVAGEQNPQAFACQGFVVNKQNR